MNSIQIEKLKSLYKPLLLAGIFLHCYGLTGNSLMRWLAFAGALGLLTTTPDWNKQETGNLKLFGTTYSRISYFVLLIAFLAVIYINSTSILPIGYVFIGLFVIHLAVSLFVKYRKNLNWPFGNKSNPPASKKQPSMPNREVQIPNIDTKPANKNSDETNDNVQQITPNKKPASSKKLETFLLFCNEMQKSLHTDFTDFFAEAYPDISYLKSENKEYTYPIRKQGYLDHFCTSCLKWENGKFKFTVTLSGTSKKNINKIASILSKYDKQYDCYLDGNGGVHFYVTKTMPLKAQSQAPDPKLVMECGKAFTAAWEMYKELEAI